MGITKRLALGFVFLWFLIGGIGHFWAEPLFQSIVPPYIPYPRAAVLVSGAFELLGSAGLLFAFSRRLAGFGLIALTIAVTPANLYMWQHEALFPDIPPSLLLGRLVFQVFYVWLIWWCTRDRA
jgi:uncharacterized membrane protein